MRWFPTTVANVRSRSDWSCSAVPGGPTRTLPIVPAIAFGLVTDHVTTHSWAAKSHVADAVTAGLVATVGAAGTPRKARAPSNASVFMETDANTGSPDRRTDNSNNAD